MAIDVNAEAERIISGRSFSPHQAGGMIADVMYLASRVRAEAIRETVEQACKAVCPQCRDGTNHHGNGVVESVATLRGWKWRTTPYPCKNIRSAFAEPGNSSESPNGSPDTLRQCVESFASGMLAKLMTKKNRAKGDRAGWLSMTADQLHRRLLQEVVELTDAVGSMESVLAIETEAHDVANFAMMIADKARSELMGEPKPTERKPNTLRPFVDAAEWLANNVITTFTPDHGPSGCRMPGCVPCQILRLAPQFKEPTP